MSIESFTPDLLSRYTEKTSIFDSFSPKSIEKDSQRFLHNLEKHHTIDRIRNAQQAFLELSVDERTKKLDQLRDRLHGCSERKLRKASTEVLGIISAITQETLGMNPSDHQIAAAIGLNDRKSVELRTGDGKTLAIALASALNAFKGEGVFVATVNQYLAKRDANFLGAMYNALGFSVAVVAESDENEDYSLYNPNIQGNNPDTSHLQSYPTSRADLFKKTDIIYTYKYALETEKLLDGQLPPSEQCLRMNTIFIDEGDLNLCDDARSPTVLGKKGEKPENTEELSELARIASRLSKARRDTLSGDYSVSGGEDYLGIKITEDGYRRLASMDPMFTDTNLFKIGSKLYQLLCSAILAQEYQEGKDYKVVIGKDNKPEIKLLHEGRLAHKRRLQKGLHQAIEAKEGVEIQAELEDIDSLVPQGFYPEFKKLAVIGGTVVPLAKSFKTIYKMDTIAIPSRFTSIMEELPPLHAYNNEDDEFGNIGKFTLVTEEVKRAMEEYRDPSTNEFAPILINTSYMTTASKIKERIIALLTEQGLTWASSEDSSEKQKKANVILNTLVATNEGYESRIIAQAGKLKTITISANMAGRGTEITYGGPRPEGPGGKALADDDQKIVVWEEEKARVIALGGMLNIEAETPKEGRKVIQRRDRTARHGLPGRYRKITAFYDDPVFQGEQVRLIQEYRAKHPSITIHEYLDKEDSLAKLHHKWEEKLMDSLEFTYRAQRIVQDHRKYFDFQKQQVLDHPEKALKRVRNVLPTYITNHLREILESEGKGLFVNSQGLLDETVLSAQSFAQTRHIYTRILSEFPALLPQDIQERKEILSMTLPDIHEYLTQQAQERFASLQSHARAAQARKAPDIKDPDQSFKSLIQSVANHFLSTAWGEHLTELDDLLTMSSEQTFGSRTRQLDWFSITAAQLADQKKVEIPDNIASFVLNQLFLL